MGERGNKLEGWGENYPIRDEDVIVVDEGQVPPHFGLAGDLLVALAALKPVQTKSKWVKSLSH